MADSLEIVISEMIDVTVYNNEGSNVDVIKVDESVFGGVVRYALLKQALVMYHANKRVGTASTKGRSMVAGSGRKLFRQKGTGFARVGNRRTGKRVGGGMIFAKVPRDFSKKMPKKQRRLARNSAILAKLQSDNVIVVDQLSFEKPRTREFVNVLRNLGVERSCLVSTAAIDSKVYLSARNVPKVSVQPVSDLNAAELCNHRKVVFTREAFESLLSSESESSEVEKASA